MKNLEIIKRYTPDFLKKIARTFLEVARKIHFEINQKGIREIEISKGIKAKFLFKNTKDIYRLNSGFEKEFKDKLVDFLQKIPPNSNIVNIGSAQGIYAVLSLVLGHKVTAIEPDNETFTLLEENMALNNPEKDRFKCLQIAIGDEDKNIKILTSGAGGQAPIVSNEKEEVNKYKRSERVEQKRFDSIFSTETPDVVIVDIEGYEFNFLKGLGEKKPQHIFMEIHPDKLETNFNSSEEEVLNFLEKMGYKEEGLPIIRGKEKHYHFVYQDKANF